LRDGLRLEYQEQLLFGRLWSGSQILDQGANGWHYHTIQIQSSQ